MQDTFERSTASIRQGVDVRGSSRVVSTCRTQRGMKVNVHVLQSFDTFRVTQNKGLRQTYDPLNGVLCCHLGTKFFLYSDQIIHVTG